MMEEYKEEVVFKIGKSRFGEYADLLISEKNSRIIHWFSGPDRRYNSRGFVISGDDIDNYIQAWRSTFEKMNLLKSELTSLKSGKFTIKGDKDLIISISEREAYVALMQYYGDRFKVSNIDDLDEVIEKYKYIKSRIVEVQKMLSRV